MLKAALAAGGQQKPAQPDTKLDAASFPCIDEGKPLPDDASFAAQLEQLHLSRQTSNLASSMPMRSARRGTVSFEQSECHLDGCTAINVRRHKP